MAAKGKNPVRNNSKYFLIEMNIRMIISRKLSYTNLAKLHMHVRETGFCTKNSCKSIQRITYRSIKPLGD
jgi:hypothetical protein